MIHTFTYLIVFTALVIARQYIPIPIALVITWGICTVLSGIVKIQLIYFSEGDNHD